MSKALLSLKNAPFFDNSEQDNESWYQITKQVIEHYAATCGDYYGVSFSNRPRLHRYFSYKLPNIERLVILMLNQGFRLDSLTDRQLQLFVMYGEEFDANIDQDSGIFLRGMPAQSQAAFLSKAVRFACNIIGNMSLALRYSGGERAMYDEDFKVLNAISEQVGTEQQRLRALCWTALVDEKMKLYYLDSIYGTDVFMHIKTAIVRHTHHLSKCFTDEQADLLLDLMLSRLADRSEYDNLRVAKMKRFNLQQWISELLISTMDVACNTEPCFAEIHSSMLDLHKYIAESEHDDEILNRRYFAFKKFRKIINQQTLSITNTVINCHRREVTAEQAQVLITSAHEKIQRATEQFQSQVPPQMSRLISRVFTAAVSLVTLGLGALVIACYNKIYYERFALEVDTSYTGMHAGWVAQQVSARHSLAPAGVNVATFFQPAERPKCQVDDSDVKGEAELLASANLTRQQDVATTAMPH
jgi:hypothetical protein